MTGTVTLTDHDDIRDWAASRAGAPAFVDISPAGGMQPMLRLVFDAQAYEDRGDRAAGGYDLVEWDEWFRLFDEMRLALVVAADAPGPRDNSYELVRQAD